MSSKQRNLVMKQTNKRIWSWTKYKIIRLTHVNWRRTQNTWACWWWVLSKSWSVHKQFIGSTPPPTGEVSVVKWQVAKVCLGRADSTHSLCSKYKNGRGRKLNGMSLFIVAPELGSIPPEKKTHSSSAQEAPSDVTLVSYKSDCQLGRQRNGHTRLYRPWQLWHDPLAKRHEAVVDQRSEQSSLFPVSGLLSAIFLWVVG